MGEGRLEPREGTRSPGRPPGTEIRNPSPSQIDSQKILGTQPSSRKRLSMFPRNFSSERGAKGWDGEGGFRMGDMWLIHVNVWQRAPQYGEVNSLQLN